MESFSNGGTSFLFWKLLCSETQSVRKNRTHPSTRVAATSLSLQHSTPFHVQKYNFSAPIFKLLPLYFRDFVKAFFFILASLFTSSCNALYGAIKPDFPFQHKADSQFSFLVPKFSYFSLASPAPTVNQSGLTFPPSLLLSCSTFRKNRGIS